MAKSVPKVGFDPKQTGSSNDPAAIGGRPVLIAFCRALSALPVHGERRENRGLDRGARRVRTIASIRRWAMEVPMITEKPRVVTFAASHFCEKARWALDWHGIAYEEVGWPPGLHQILAKSCGAKHTTVPIVFDGQDVIQGSGAIIDWADKSDKDRTRSLTPPADRGEVRRSSAVPMRSSAFMFAAWPSPNCSPTTHMWSNLRFSIEHQDGGAWQET